MFKRISRWNWLVVFAVGNLVFWIAVAIGVGLLVTDTLDLGVESFIRTRQATVAVLWDKISAAQPSAQAFAQPSVQEPATLAPTHLAVRNTALPATALPATAPPATALPATALPGMPAAANADPMARPLPTTPPPEQTLFESTLPTASPPAPGPQIEDTAAASAMAGPATPLPQSTTVLLDSPLLVSDPDVSGMAGIDAEMSRSAVGRPVQIRYTEETLNRQVAAALANYPDLPYQNLKLDLERNGVVIRGNVTIMGFQVKAEVQGTVFAQDCMPQAEISKISIAGMLTPGFVRDGIEKMVLDSLSWYPPDYPLCMEQIVLEQDRVTIYGSRR